MPNLSRNRRLAVLAACLASFAASSTVLLSHGVHNMSKAGLALVFAIGLSLAVLLLGFAATRLKRDRSDNPRNPQAS